jgi:hypothetical protein
MKIGHILTIAALLGPNIAIAQQPADRQPAVVGASAERMAVVESVNMNERTVLLRGQDGQFATLRVGPDARNLAQVKPGDRVVVTVTEAVAASLADPRDGRGPTDSAAVATRAPAGERPAGSLTEAKRVRVRVERVDTGSNTVAFLKPDGTRGEVRVGDPRMREFASTLKPGDEVDVVLLESVSLRVLPPG